MLIINPRSPRKYTSNKNKSAFSVQTCVKEKKGTRVQLDFFRTFIANFRN